VEELGADTATQERHAVRQQIFTQGAQQLIVSSPDQSGFDEPR
jgi:hypothetical protein